ncbi:MAG TPA: RNA pseudouridine synthase [Bacteriovoracaceae bacterium]|nr:RNA pseudouridine synthase [Bacteriovoracaceae bacterium]
MDQVELQWLFDEATLKEALQGSLNCSGQLLKKHFSSKQLTTPQKAHTTVRLPVDLVNHLQLNPIYSGPKSRIIKETADYIAIHKPPGVHSHPLCYTDQDTALNFLVQEKKWDALNINQSSYDRGLLYRLDLETSGVLLLAKNADFFSKIRNDFHAEIKSKLYWAVVDGSFNQEGSHTHYFRASGPKGSKQRVGLESHPDANEGIFKVKKVMEANGKSLLLVNLRSGLRHQIRAQLASLGFPILGDELYGGTHAQRLFLHAWRYEWTEVVEDNEAELFDSFLDLNSALQMSHDMLRTF